MKRFALSRLRYAACVPGVALALAVPLATSGHNPPPLVPIASTRGVTCNKNTQIGLDGCAALAAAAADKRLDADIRAVWARESSYQRADFARAQRDWATYRTADCTSQTDLYRGGSILPMELGYCQAREDGLRRQDLVVLYKTLTQGASKPPRFP